MPEPNSRFTGLDPIRRWPRHWRASLPRMAERTVTAIIAEVPASTDPFRGRMGQNIENAVQASLGRFCVWPPRVGTRLRIPP